jgi:molybdate transport system substrate-binding protein
MTNRPHDILIIIVLSAISQVSCATKPKVAEIHVAAAANLRNAFADLSRAYGSKSNVIITPSFGPTAQLAQQIENGAPVDLFLSADTQHVDQLIAKGVASADSRAVYARGRLVLWAPSRPDIRSLTDLAATNVHQVGIARPELAPYGAAAVQALKHENLWTAVEPKLVYAQSISASRQFADSGNTDAAFTAFSLIVNTPVHYVEVDENLHDPLDQALCLTSTGSRNAAARDFRTFLLSTDAKPVFKRYGYDGSKK